MICSCAFSCEAVHVHHLDISLILRGSVTREIYLTRPQFRQQDIIHNWPRFIPTKRLLLLIDRTPFQHPRVNIRVIVQFPRIRLSLLSIWASITSDSEIHDDCIVVEMFVGSRSCFISSPPRKSEMTYGERPIYEDPPLGGLSQDGVTGLHPA